MDHKTLIQVAAEQPFPDYGDWWTMGQVFSGFMSEAIVSQWSKLQHENDLGVIGYYFSKYLDVVYGKQAKVSLVDDFVSKEFSRPIQSGEFDALSYSFFRSAFESIEKQVDELGNPPERERRLFTKRVGRVFFSQLHDYLGLELFELIGCDARETEDSDPIDYPADKVVEMWEIRYLA